MVKFDEKTELSDVICDECSKLSGKPVDPILKASVLIKTTNATQNISSKIRVKL